MSQEGIGAAAAPAGMDSRALREHIDVSVARVEAVNRRNLAVQLPFERVIENKPFADPVWILGAIQKLLAEGS